MNGTWNKKDEYRLKSRLKAISDEKSTCVFIMNLLNLRINNYDKKFPLKSILKKIRKYFGTFFIIQF